VKIALGLALVSGGCVLQAQSVCAQDIAKGKAVFAQCAACHSLDGSNGLGPSLQAIAGRKPGSFPGFRYSRAMKAVRSNWDAVSLDAYIADPQSAVPGNVMPFSGIPDKQQREDLIAFLLTMN
jgi:cytochrome c